MSKTKDFPPVPEQPFVGHLIELRDRLLRSVVAILLVFLALFSFANDLYSMLAEPLLRHMPQGTSMIATEVASPFLTPFKLTLVLSVFISIPYLLYQAWGFVAPALYAKEKRLIFPLLLSSTLLFYTGMAFAYFVVFPLVFGFLTGVVPEGVAVMTDISRYLDFVLKLFFAFGIAFEVPIATILVIWAGLITREELAKKRPYIIVAAFVIGMLLTPPDVISQTLLALPMWVLFELGLVLSRFYRKSPTEDDAENDKDIVDEAREMHSPTPQTASATGPSNDILHDDSPGSADHYSEADEGSSELSDDDMDREFDRLEAEEDYPEDWDDTTQQHEEFEPIEEERQRLADQKADADTDTNEPDSDDPPPSKT